MTPEQAAELKRLIGINTGTMTERWEEHEVANRKLIAYIDSLTQAQAEQAQPVAVVELVHQAIHVTPTNSWRPEPQLAARFLQPVECGDRLYTHPQPPAQAELTDAEIDEIWTVWYSKGNSGNSYEDSRSLARAVIAADRAKNGRTA